MIKSSGTISCNDTYIYNGLTNTFHSYKMIIQHKTTKTFFQCFKLMILFM